MIAKNEFQNLTRKEKIKEIRSVYSEIGFVRFVDWLLMNSKYCGDITWKELY